MPKTPLTARTGPAAEATRIGELLEQGRIRDAVESAKEFAKRSPGPASDELLVESYSARIRQLQAEGLDRDARSLCDLVERRIPASRERMTALRNECDLLAQGFRGLLAALERGDGDERRRLLVLLARKLCDPGVLADSEALPEDHPLKLEARAVRAVFTAATSGPLPDEAMATLDFVSRSSPLAPWKLLIRAIDGFYRGDPESVRRNVAALSAGSAVTPLGALLLAASGADPQKPLSVPVAALAEKLSSGRGTLRESLEELERGLEKRDQHRASRFAERVLAALPAGAGSVRQRFRATLVARWVRAGFPPEALPGEVSPGRANRLDTIRYLALAMEQKDWTQAVGGWDIYLELRSLSGPPTGKETAAVLLHMASLFPPSEDDVASALGVHCPECLRQEIRDGTLPAFFDREALLARAVAADGSRRGFLALFSFQSGLDEKVAAETAARWHAARPGDPEPLVFLVEEAMRRKGWKRALSLLERAEEEKHLGPELRGKRFSVLVGQLEMQIQKGQCAGARASLVLARKEPQASESELGAYLAALEWALCQSGRKPEPTATLEAAKRLAARAHNPAFVWILMASAGELLKRSPLLPATILTPRESFAALVRTQRLVPRLDRPLKVPGEVLWSAEGHLDGASPDDLLALCEGGGAMAWPREAFAATTRGIASDGPLLARFLGARARALTTRNDAGPPGRVLEILRAALALAGTNHDTEGLGSVSTALRHVRATPGGRKALSALGVFGEDLPDAEAIRAVVAKERLLPAILDSPKLPRKVRPTKPPGRPAKKKPESQREELSFDFGDLE